MIKLHPERCASKLYQHILAHLPGCIIVFQYSWGSVRFSLNPMLMALIPPGYLVPFNSWHPKYFVIYVSYQSIGKKGTNSAYKTYQVAVRKNQFSPAKPKSFAALLPRIFWRSIAGKCMMKDSARSNALR